MLALKHRVFRIEPRPWIYWSLEAALRDIDRVRQLAEDFAGQVGVEHVVSIVEHAALPRFTVVVWYRGEQGAEAKPATADEFFEAPSYR